MQRYASTSGRASNAIRLRRSLFLMVVRGLLLVREARETATLARTRRAPRLVGD